MRSFLLLITSVISISAAAQREIIYLNGASPRSNCQQLTVENLQFMMRVRSVEEVLDALGAEKAGSHYGFCRIKEDPNSFYEGISLLVGGGLSYFTYSQENYNKIEATIRKNFRYIGQVETEGSSGNLKYYFDGSSFFALWDYNKIGGPKRIFVERNVDVGNLSR